MGRETLMVLMRALSHKMANVYSVGGLGEII